MAETLTIEAGAAGLQALLARAVGIETTASARFRQLTPDMVDVFVTTPFSVTVTRRVKGVAGRDGATVGANDLLQALAEGRSEIGPARDANWPGSLPPIT